MFDSGAKALLTKDGDILLVGNLSPQIYGRNDQPEGNIIAFRITENGQNIWRKEYRLAGMQEAFGIANSEDGGFLFVGREFQDPDDGSSSFAIKIGKNGKLKWKKKYKTGKGFNARAQAATPNVGGGHALVANGGDRSPTQLDMYAFKINKKGKKAWRKRLGLNFDDSAYDIIRMRDGSFVVGGSVDTSHDGEYAKNTHKVLVAKLDNKGREKWRKIIDVEGDFFSVKLVSINNDSIMAVSKAGIRERESFTHLSLIDSDGGIVWQKKHPKVASAVGFNRDNSALLAGASDGETWVNELDSNGNILRSWKLEGMPCGSPNSINQTPKGTFVIAGEPRVSRNDTDITACHLTVK